MVLKSVAVWSPKGGVGKSVLAVALALKLAERQRTALIDGNPDNPDLVSLLQCSGYPNVTGWVTPSGPAQLESLMVRHSDRLWVLPGPPRYVEEASLSGSMMEGILESGTQAGMTVVVDLGSALSRDSTVAALDKVDRVLVPVTLDLLSVSPLKRLFRELELLRLPAAKFRVVVNRYTSTREITVDDIREFSEFPVDGAIPSEKELAAAVNRGEIASVLGGDSPVGKAIAKLAEPMMAGAPPVQAEKARPKSGLLRVFLKGGN